MPIARLDELELNYLEYGDPDRPALLLIAGLPAVADDWGPLAEELADLRRPIAYDNRGSGASTVTPGPYTTAQLAQDGLALLDALGVERAAVCGFSMGGMIAQELTLAAPERVERLILGCTHAGMDHAEPPVREAGLAFAMETDDWGERMRALAPFAFRPGVDGEFLDRFTAKKTGDVQDPGGYRAQIAAFLSHDTYDRLPEITCPTLIVTGDADQILPAAGSTVLHERIPGSTLEVIPEAGHLFFLEQPDVTRRLFRRFLGAET